jgi:hypothetical protein
MAIIILYAGWFLSRRGTFARTFRALGFAQVVVVAPGLERFADKPILRLFIVAEKAMGRGPGYVLYFLAPEPAWARHADNCELLDRAAMRIAVEEAGNRG